MICNLWFCIKNVDMKGSVFESVKYLKGGKRSRWLRWVMVEAATRAVSIDDYYKSFYERLKKRKGKQVAKVAVARKMLVGIYYILKKKEPFKKGKGLILPMKFGVKFGSYAYLVGNL